MRINRIATLSVVAIALAAYAGFLQVENSRLKGRLAAIEVQPPMEDEAEAATKEPEEPAPSLAEAGDAEDSEPEATRGQAGGQPAASEAAESPESEWRARREAMREAMRQRMERFFADPDMRLDQVERSMIRIDERYADFFKKLDLDPEEIEVIKTLMAEREVLGREARFQMMAAETDEEREAVREKLQADRDLLSEEIEQKLGEENAARMRTYEAGLPYKDTVEQFALSQSYGETPLSDRQSEALLNAYARVNQQYQYTHDLSGMNRWERRNIDRQQLETYFRERELFEAEVLSAAASALSEAQLASLAEKQLADREREKREMLFQLENPLGGRRGGWGGPPRD